MKGVKRFPFPWAFVALTVVVGLVSACNHTGPRLAIAMGDSFISGEGAENFISGDGAADYASTPPSDIFVAENQTDPYFCHKSQNASIYAANLPGIDEVHNLACSGAEPEDLSRPNPDFRVVTGGLATFNVAPQLDQLWNTISGKTVKVIKVSLGANNSVNNFSGILAYCHMAFMIDAAGGLAASFGRSTARKFVDDAAADGVFFPDPDETIKNKACDPNAFYTEEQRNIISTAYADGLKRLIVGMRLRGYAPGEWKLVLQGYGTPFAPIPNQFLLAEGRDEERDNRFARLARARYAAGCPLHIGTMEIGDDLAAVLTSIVRDAATQTRDEFPAEKIIFLDVAYAFDGKRLCEEANSPAGAFFNPIWFRDPTNNNEIAREIPQNRAAPMLVQWEELATSCKSGDNEVFARCQDAGHPNEAGHAALGACLREAVGRADTPGVSSDMACSRNSANGVITVGDL